MYLLSNVDMINVITARVGQTFKMANFGCSMEFLNRTRSITLALNRVVDAWPFDFKMDKHS